MERKEVRCQFLVIGGGMSGVCAALAAARKGVKTVLVQDRPVLGGNASAEIRMHICGADYHMSRPNARETGILEEILLENKRRNPTMNYPIFNSVLWEKVRFQENLELYLNTTAMEVRTENNHITAVEGYQMTTEKTLLFFADYFMDATGDGVVGARAGAAYQYGRESRTEYGESLAPGQADRCTMGSSLMFQARDVGRPVPFVRPKWANRYTEEQLRNREHELLTSGYWWIELGGTRLNVIEDAEELRDELMKAVYGIWDHIKNTPGHHAENMDLTWVGVVPGRRESRRLVGDYLLNEADCAEGKIFDDAVAYGGWPMDIHTTDGLSEEEDVPTVWNQVEDVYTIPYRCLYSRNIDNLFLGGRAISCTHVAFSSTRVMATCAVVGQAVGTAAAMAVKRGCTPRAVGAHIRDLQQILIKDDCYIPGIYNEDERDLARTAAVTANRWDEGFEPEQVISGYGRMENGKSHCWQADLIREASLPELVLEFDREYLVEEIRLKLDSNLSREITPSINDEVLGRQEFQSPSELIREYDLMIEGENGKVEVHHLESNGQRLQVIRLERGEACRKLTICPKSTYGDGKARIFEVRVYEQAKE